MTNMLDQLTFYGLIGNKTTITAKTMCDLRHKIYKRERWTRTFGESHAKRMNSAYTIKMDIKNNQWKAVKNESA